MSIDGPNIIDGDLAHDVRDTFLELYDKGLPIEEIRRHMTGLEMANDDLEREIFCSVLCQVLWDVGSLNPKDLDELARFISEETGLKRWKELGEGLYESRKKVLNRQLAKLAVPKSRARKRIPPITSLFESGDCLLYTSKNGGQFGLLVLRFTQHGTKGIYQLAPVICPIGEMPRTKAQFLSARVLGKRVPTTCADAVWGPGAGPCIIGLAVALENHRALARSISQFKKVATIEIDFTKAALGTFSGLALDEALARILNDRILDLELWTVDQFAT